MLLILAQDVTGYPTLKFFKSGADSGVKYRGQRDIDSLANFIEEQMGRGEQKEGEVSLQYFINHKKLRAFFTAWKTFILIGKKWKRLQGTQNTLRSF